MKKIVFTGGTSGIGLVAAKALVAKGHDLYLFARNSAKTKNAIEEIKSCIQGGGEVYWVECDLFSPDSVVKACNEVLRKWPSIDVVVNNAGGIQGDRIENGLGWEWTFAVNTLAPVIISKRFESAIKPGGRIVNTVSKLERQGKIDFDNLQSEKSYSMLGSYSTAKLATTQFTIELAEELKSKSITVNCLHPGVVRTNFAKETGGLLGRIWMTVFGVFLLSPEKGAETLLHLIDSDEVGNITGKYWEKKRVVEPSKAAQNEELRKKVVAWLYKKVAPWM